MASLKMSKAQQDVLWRVLVDFMAEPTSTLNLTGREQRSLRITYNKLQGMRALRNVANQPGSRELSVLEAEALLVKAIEQQGHNK